MLVTCKAAARSCIMHEYWWAHVAKSGMHMTTLKELHHEVALPLLCLADC